MTEENKNEEVQEEIETKEKPKKKEPKEEKKYEYEGDMLTKEQIEQRKKKEKKEIIQGFISGEQEVFEEEYKFNEEQIHFKIRVKEANAMEEAKIHSEVVRAFDGIQTHISQEYYLAFDMLARIQICGKVHDGEDRDFVNPTWIANQDSRKVNRRALLLLMRIGADYSHWESRFLG